MTQLHGVASAHPEGSVIPGKHVSTGAIASPAYRLIVFLNREQGRRETDREEALFKNTQEGRILTCAGSRPQSQVAPSLKKLAGHVNGEY